MFFFRWIVPIVGLAMPILLESARTGKPIGEHFGTVVTLVYLASPFLVLAGLTWLVRSRWVLGAALVALIGSHCYAWYSVTKSTSSTATLGILAAPIYELVLVLPVAVFAALLVEALITRASRSVESR